MQRISITNPQNIIDGTAKKYYFKLRNTGGPKGDKGDKGDTGATGPQGPQGDPCTVIVNSTATLEPGSNAYVTNTGSLSNAVLNFGIPQGPQGPQGAKGDKGDTGAQGETGPRGPQGERGTNATVSIGTTYTLNPGTQATVYNSGTDSNAVLNFGIPQGAKGDTGSQGPQGPTGPAGQNFAPTIVAELPTTGDSSKLYLTPKAHTTSTATGNPITATVSDGAGSLESFQLDGDTEQQTYSGINLLDNSEYNTGSSNSVSYTRNADGTYTLAGTASAFTSFRMGYVQFDTETQVYLTGAPEGASMGTFSVNLMKNGSSSGWQTDAFAEGRAYTLEANTPYYFAIVVRKNAEVSGLVFKPQIELGSSGSDYQPFVGGTQSPNPDYPQPIQTVTGTQTISINGTDYPLDLGTIELCKLGTYQDYIWKDGEDWKIHKATGYEKRLVSLAGIDGYSSVYGTATTSNGAFSIFSTNWGSDYATTAGTALASTVVGRYQSQNVDSNVSANSMADGTFCQRSGTNDRVYFRFASWARVKTVDEVQQMLTNNGGVDLWYPLAAATDTAITDTTLIAQLEAIRTASLENGANTITNTATGSNLAGDMEIGYYGYNPRNRYDKWLWLDLNNNYEQIGS